MSIFLRLALFFALFSTQIVAQNLEELKIRCDSLYNTGNYKASLFFAARCVELSQTAHDTIAASMLHRLANAHLRLNQNEAAETNYRASLKLRQQFYGENASSCATSMHGLGNAVMGQGRLLEAQQIFLKSLQIRDFLKQKPVRQYAATLNSLAIIAGDLGNISESESYFQKSCDRYSAISGENTKEFAVPFGNLAQCNTQLGNFERALPLLRKSLKLREEVYGKNHPLYATALQGLGEFYVKTENYALAEPLVRASLSIREERLGYAHSQTLNSMDFLATIFLGTGKIDSAELLVREMIARYDTVADATNIQRAGFLNSLGEVLFRKKDLESAEDCFKKAVFLQKDNPAESPDVYMQSLQELAKTYFLRGKFADADAIYKSAQELEFELFDLLFPHLSERERQIYFKPFAIEMERYATFANAAEAEIPTLGGQLLDLRMATRGILFSASQKTLEQFRRDGNLPDYEKWKQARERLAALMLESPEIATQMGVSVADLNETIRMLEKKLGEQNVRFRQENEKNSVRWQNIQASLGFDEAAVEIIRFKKRGIVESDSIIYVGILVTRETTDQPIFIHFNEGNALESVYFDLYQSEIGQTSLLPMRRNSPAFRSFWQPIERVLGEKKRVFFALDGVFHKINLGTLRNLDGQFLSEKYDFRYVTNLADLVKTEKNQVTSGPQTAMLVGNPTFNLSENAAERSDADFLPISGENLRTIFLRPLPESEIEVRNIDRFFVEKGWNSQVFVQKTALENVVKNAESPTVLHIATHGFFLENDDKLSQNDTTFVFKSPLLRSMLFFAGAENLLRAGQFEMAENDQNGILTAYEVQNMSLELTELVTLSACQSGRGDVESGEGVFGLQRAFQIAGAKSLLMSLWPVDDTATRLLMTVFYEKWLGGNSKIESLRMAEAAVRLQFPEPAKWGGFILVGM